MDQQHIRNFCIIAHIDHGKSTLADRLIELTDWSRTPEDEGSASRSDGSGARKREGITIKLQPVQMHATQGGVAYQLNLVDTPGHVDFHYEVSRSLAAVEGAILLVDATKGVSSCRHWRICIWPLSKA